MQQSEKISTAFKEPDSELYGRMRGSTISARCVWLELWILAPPRDENVSNVMLQAIVSGIGMNHIAVVALWEPQDFTPLWAAKLHP
jgi:hypothetical protein